jgi:N-acetylgalactosamine-N,N'-diacetylbacillosaminyl-diphospho-undecaprenol 4-alpha-N-acetylgalactosaminyltransferase
LAKLKRLGDVIQAFSKLENNNAELIFVGNGEQENHLKEMTKQLGLENRIHFLGYQTNPYQYLSRADYFVSASETEGLPNTLIESMICGTPVISSDCVSGPREILHPESDLTISLKDKMEHGSHGILYPVGAVELLADAMKLLLEDEALCNKFIQRGYSRIEEFEAMNIAQKYIDTFPSEGKEFAKL